MYKLIHLTDTHLTLPGKPLYGIDPEARYKAAIDHLIDHNSDADCMVITGDLSHWGEPDAFRVLNTGLERLPFPTHLIIGNHDDRDVFRTECPHVPNDTHGFIQYRVETEAGTFLFLDTVQAGTHAGWYCEERLAWLKQALDEASGSVYLFMHHPPFPIHIPRMDRIGIVQQEAIADVIVASGKVRHIFFGHVHRPISGSWNGISFTTQFSTNHQVPLEFRNTDEGPDEPEFTYEPPAYNVVCLEPGHTVVHTCFYSLDSDHITFGDAEDTDYEMRAKGAAMTANR